MRKWIVAAVIGLSVSGLVFCAEEVAKPPAKPEVTITKPPGKPKDVKLAPRKPVPRAKVLDKGDLFPFVPKPPKGWTAGKPTGKTQRIAHFAVTQVSRVYRKGGQTVTFIMEDLGSGNPYFFMKQPWKPQEKKTPDGYQRKLMLGKMAVEESFRKKQERGLIFLVLENRIQLNIGGTGLTDTSFLVELAKTIDFKKLKKVLEEKSK